MTDDKFFIIALREAFCFVASKRDELCKLDTGIGDGDHGITVERGFGAAAILCERFNGEMSALFEAIGEEMVFTMGGAIGPVYGAFWSGIAEVCQDKSLINGEILAEAFARGCALVMALGKVSPGDKTVVDAMFACKEAMLGEQQHDLGAALNAGALAARSGAESTKDMVAKRGRARFSGDKSKGYVDPGATSFAMFMEALAAAFHRVKE